MEKYNSIKINFWLVLFLLALSGNLISVELQLSQPDRITKPLLMPVLIGYFISQTQSETGNLKKWLIAALFFSWAGDVLLMFQADNSLFFLAGLSSFLVAHIFYIIYFHQLRLKGKINLRFWLLLPVAVYYGVLISILSPYLAEMKWPVWIYGAVISCMLLLAIHMVFIKNKASGKLLAGGAVLFVISDSILAVNKFYQPFELAGILIMLTYGLAQLLITEGAIHCSRSAISV